MSRKRPDLTTLIILGVSALGAVAFVSLILLRIFVFDLYTIPAASMYPTLRSGDWVITARRAYIESDPQPGDVVVFTIDNGVVFSKRVIGLPGQTVVYRDKRLYIDSVAVPAGAPADQSSLLLVTETLGDYRYQVLLDPKRKGEEGEYQVPEGHYFMLGDSRDKSHDSRYSGVGFVPRERILGRVIYSLSSGRQGLQPGEDAVRGTALPD